MRVIYKTHKTEAIKVAKGSKGYNLYGKEYDKKYSRCLEYFEINFSAGTVRMTALIYCQSQCSHGKFQLEIHAGALRLTFN
jgi:hypothetical protein